MKLCNDDGSDLIVEYFCKGLVVSYLLCDDYVVDYVFGVCYLYLMGVVLVIFVILCEFVF